MYREASTIERGLLEIVESLWVKGTEAWIWIVNKIRSDIPIRSRNSSMLIYLKRLKQWSKGERKDLLKNAFQDRRRILKKGYVD